MRVVEHVAVGDDVGGPGVEGRDVDLVDAPPFRQAGDLLRHVHPVLPAVARDVDLPVVGAGPEHVRIGRRDLDREERAVGLGAREVVVDGAARDDLLGLVVARQVRREDGPVSSPVGRLEDDVAAEVDLVRVLRRHRDRARPVETVLQVRRAHLGNSGEVGTDVPGEVRLLVQAVDVPVLRVGVDDRGIRWRRHDVLSVPSRRDEPIRRPDAAAGEGV